MLLLVHTMLAGVCLYATVHHFWIGLRQPRQAKHLWFAVLSFSVTLYVLAKHGSYAATSIAELIAMRRIEFSFAAITIAVLPWFVAAYTGFRARLPLIVLSAAGAVFLAVNLVLPYGMNFEAQMPSLEPFVLPWGETVADLRVRQRGPWYSAGWVYLIFTFLFCVALCVYQFRRGDSRRAVALAAALAVFLASILFVLVVSLTDLRFVPAGEYGFVALVLLMSATLTRQLRSDSDALAASEARFRTLAEQATDSIFLHDIEGRFVDVNQQACATLGYSRDELLGMTVTDIDVDYAPDQARALWNGLKPGVPVTVEGRHRRKDGSVFPVEVRIGLFHLDQKTFGLAIARDITERKQAEETLRRNEQTFRATISAIAEGIVMQDAADEILVCNAAAERILGLSRDQLMGLSSYSPNWRAIHEDGSPFLGHDHPAVRARRTGMAVSGEIMGVQRADGSLVWIEINSRPIVDAQGHVEATVTSFSDVTERRAAEHALREAQRLGKMGSWELNLQNGVVLWSDEVYRIFEVDPVGFTPTFESYLERIHPGDRERLTTAYQNSLEQRSPYEIEHRLLLPGGRIKYLRCKGETEYRDDKPVRTWGMVQDVTELVESEEEIRRLNTTLEQRVRDRTAELQMANKELESFSYSVSHDLRAPLRAIDGFARILADDYSRQLDDTARDYLERVRAAAQRMGALIDDLLNLARVSRIALRRETVDLSQIARDVADELQRGEPERKVTVAIENGVSGVGDPNLLRVLLHNLLGNAWKYTRKVDAARIEFGETTDRGGRCLFVRDNGAGFDVQYADKLFAPFQRLHSAQEFEGTGIGLATVARIVYRHGGSVWAEGEVGRGATFYFTLSDRHLLGGRPSVAA